VFKVIFNNTSVIMWWSVVFGGINNCVQIPLEEVDSKVYNRWYNHTILYHQTWIARAKVIGDYHHFHQFYNYIMASTPILRRKARTDTTNWQMKHCLGTLTLEASIGERTHISGISLGLINSFFDNFLYLLSVLNHSN